MRPNRYIWLGTHKLYDAFTFDFVRTEHGWFQAHIYKFDENTTTFIVECPEHVWQAHRLDEADQQASIAFCEKLFANTLGGASLMTNARHLRGSAWLNFQRVKCANWSTFNGNSHVVLMGDAVHTAHFAIGSGTKLALEDAIELVRQFKALGDTADRIPEVLKHYQAVREIDVIRLQNAAWNAMEPSRSLRATASPGFQGMADRPRALHSTALPTPSWIRPATTCRCSGSCTSVATTCTPCAGARARPSAACASHVTTMAADRRAPARPDTSSTATSGRRSSTCRASSVPRMPAPSAMSVSRLEARGNQVSTI